ncbi:hypothetical protein [Spiroplasma turonicum]|uniref:Lipoprotein n=1 Tax=Spiroplasma turonicum TaxID=216946 RepID=A0A0K1P794_9MOLU|nr:hypothetical protein [Spiroplasma turonicum]AKU80148.1 hypothetical protein STURON_00902 [Spiroplasma turonicum]ALX71148.1 hypothetical protein STURO_v1c08970 [Spiroplasma turonicum]
MLKLVLSFCAVTSITGCGVSTLVKNTNDNDYYEKLKEDILTNKKYIGSVNYNDYDGQRFYSENSLNEYILGKSYIDKVYTSSNPSKIIKDYENSILDENKIYDLDTNNSKQVFRDVFNNATLSSSDALNTYVNKGNIKEKYSYDSIKWFSTPEEAKLYEKEKLSIYNSIFYMVNGYYYNAFNIDDIENLLASFEEGLNVNINKSLNGTKLINPYSFAGTISDFRSNVKDFLNPDFMSKYFSDVIDIDSENSLTITPTGNNEFRVNQNGTQKIYYGSNNESYKIRFANKYSSNFEMIKDFKDISKWDTSGSEGTWSIGRRYWKRDIEILNQYNRVEKVTIILMPKWSYGFGKNNPSFDFYNYHDDTISSAKVYLNKKDKENKTNVLGVLSDLPLRYGVNDITQEEKTKLFDIFFDNYFQKVLTNFAENSNKRLTYADILKGNNIYNINETVKKDLVYKLNNGIGKNYTILQSISDFNIRKEKIKENGKWIDDEIKYELNPGLYVNEKELDTFLPLNNGINSFVKYFQSYDMLFSNREGNKLSGSMEEAKEKAFINGKRTLKKQYIAYDVFGNTEVSGESEEDVIRKMQNKIYLESKLVNNNEIKTWNLNFKKSFDSIISDGRYLVYKIKNINKPNDYLYFPSFELALNSIKSSLNIDNILKNKISKRFYYDYIDYKNINHRILFFDDDIESVLSKIKSYLEGIIDL